jgi:branched-chain amino acid transport system permease protein
MAGTGVGVGETAATRPAAAGVPLRSWRLAGICGLVAVACVLPFTMSGFRLFQFTQVFILSIALLGLNILTGFNGQISLGHGAFFAIGAYTTAIMMDKWNIDYGWTIPAAGMVCLVVGFLFGRPALRLEGLYLALATFSLALAVPQILKYFEHWTGGSQGIVLLKPEAPFGLPLSSDQWLYFLTLAVLIITFVLAWNLLRGRTGRAIVAIRDNPLAAEAMGINNALSPPRAPPSSAIRRTIRGPCCGTPPTRPRPRSTPSTCSRTSRTPRSASSSRTTISGRTMSRA